MACTWGYAASLLYAAPELVGVLLVSFCMCCSCLCMHDTKMEELWGHASIANSQEQTHCVHTCVQHMARGRTVIEHVQRMSKVEHRMFMAFEYMH